MRSSVKKSQNTTEHLFEIGQAVRLKRKVKVGEKEIFHVTGLLPLREGAPQYRIKNPSEEHERVISQELIEVVNLKSSGEIEKTKQEIANSVADARSNASTEIEKINANVLSGQQGLKVRVRKQLFFGKNQHQITPRLCSP